MGYELRVSIDTLRKVTEVLLNHLEQKQGPSVSLHEDYFWSIPPDTLYDVTREPNPLTIGQLSESFENIESIASDPEAAISFGLVWLADVLRAVGHQEVL